MSAFRLVSVIAAAGMLGTSLVSVSGCTSYTNVPGPESGPAITDPNGLQAERATKAALVWAARRHPVDGAFLLNLPVGTSLETANDIAATIGQGATVPTSESVDLPVYHVTRVWIRVSDAKVDVVYPMTDGEADERGVTVWLSAGVRPWTVSRGQYWNPGTVPVPPIWVPLPEAELQAMRDEEKTAARDAKRQARQQEGETAPEPASETIPPAPAAEPAAPAASEPAPQPVVEPVAEPAAEPGAVYREVPVGGGA